MFSADCFPYRHVALVYIYWQSFDSFSLCNLQPFLQLLPIISPCFSLSLSFLIIENTKSSLLEIVVTKTRRSRNSKKSGGGIWLAKREKIEKKICHSNIKFFIFSIKFKILKNLGFSRSDFETETNQKKIRRLEERIQWIYRLDKK